MRTPTSVVASVVAACAVMAVAGCTATTSGRPSTIGSSSASASGATSSSAPSGAAFTDLQQATKILADAENAIRVVNSYDYRQLPKLRSEAQLVTTGAYRTQFEQAYQLLVANAGKLHATQQASVTRIGLGPVSGSEASVLAVGRLASNSTSGRHTTPFTAVAHLRLVSAHWRLSQLELDGRLTGSPPGTPALADAVASARGGVQALLTLRRASLAADQRNALARTTGTLRTELQQTGAKASATVTKGDFDLIAVIDAVAVERASGPSATVLVHATGYRVIRGKRSAPAKQSVEVTLARSGSGWLLSNLVNVGAG